MIDLTKKQKKKYKLILNEKRVAQISEWFEGCQEAFGPSIKNAEF